MSCKQEKKGKLSVTVEKRPKGKTVTVIANVVGNPRQLLTSLQCRVGCGGTVLGNRVELQGSHEKEIYDFFHANNLCKVESKVESKAASNIAWKHEDWTCRNCNNLNLGERSSCTKCGNFRKFSNELTKLSQTEQMMSASSSVHGGEASEGPRTARWCPADWIYCTGYCRKKRAESGCWSAEVDDCLIDVDEPRRGTKRMMSSCDSSDIQGDVHPGQHPQSLDDLGMIATAVDEVFVRKAKKPKTQAEKREQRDRLASSSSRSKVSSIWVRAAVGPTKAKSQLHVARKYKEGYDLEDEMDWDSGDEMEDFDDEGQVWPSSTEEAKTESSSELSFQGADFPDLMAGYDEEEQKMLARALGLSSDESREKAMLKLALRRSVDEYTRERDRQEPAHRTPSIPSISSTAARGAWQPKPDTGYAVRAKAGRGQPLVSKPMWQGQAEPLIWNAAAPRKVTQHVESADFPSLSTSSLHLRSKSAARTHHHMESSSELERISSLTLATNSTSSAKSRSRNQSFECVETCECPCCGCKVPMVTINQHVDECLNLQCIQSVGQE